jgi:hypothetical protein
MILLTPYSPDQIARRQPRRRASGTTGFAARVKRLLSDLPRTADPERYLTVLGGRSELHADHH